MAQVSESFRRILPAAYQVSESMSAFLAALTDEKSVLTEARQKLSQDPAAVDDNADIFIITADFLRFSISRSSNS